jgi:hypothetical protein
VNDWSNDDELMAALGEAVAEADAVSDRRREMARAAFTWRTVDAELMELLHDSALDAGAAVRGAGDPGRLLSFGLAGIGLELEVGAGELAGQVLPAQDATVTLQHAGARARTVAADGAGFFRFEGVESGSVRLTVTTSERALMSPWVTI